MNFKKFKEVKTPTRAYSNDAGLDLYLPEEITLKPFETLCIGMGIGFDIPEGLCGIMMPRSSINKKGIVVGNAVIDCNYKGEIHLIIINCSGEYFHFQKDDRLCSIVFYHISTEELNEVEDLGFSERNDKNFGSSGK